MIATGSRARRSPWGEGEHIHLLRTSGDAERLRMSWPQRGTLWSSAQASSGGRLPQRRSRRAYGQHG
ncbi:hypothetical protein AB1285_23115 [Microbacterium sp. NRRL B-14842]